LTNDRPYRKALGAEEAVSVIREETEKGWWDRRVVEVFAGMVEA
jgi:putative two-component system response regulator